MSQLKKEFQMPAGIFLVITLGWILYSVVSDYKVENNMSKEARKYFVKEMEKWKRGEENKIQYVLPHYVSFRPQDWYDVRLIDYKILNVKVSKRRKRNNFNFLTKRKYKYIPDHVVIKVRLFIEDNSGVKSTEDVDYSLRPSGKKNWIITS